MIIQVACSIRNRSPHHTIIIMYKEVQSANNKDSLSFSFVSSSFSHNNTKTHRTKLLKFRCKTDFTFDHYFYSSSQLNPLFCSHLIIIGANINTAFENSLYNSKAIKKKCYKAVVIHCSSVGEEKKNIEKRSSRRIGEEDFVFLDFFPFLLTIICYTRE